jgi:hypothetical protein
LAEALAGEVYGALLSLPKQAQSAIVGALFTGETVEFAVAGEKKKALAGTDRRVLIYQGGSAGPLVSWDYETITAVQLHRSRMRTGVIILDIPGLPPVSTSYWTSGSADAARAANAIPLPDGDSLKAAEIAVNALRRKLEQRHTPFSPSHDTSPPDDTLRRVLELSDLKDQGVLTPDEFTVLKTWLLETRGWLE